MGTLGIALIAKNEEENLPNLLESISGAFDRAVLLDTGSTDKTIDVFAKWARQQEGMTYSVASWEWNDDFSDARNASDRLLLWGSALPDVDTSNRPLVDWRCWADADDVLVGATSLRSVVENADERITAFFAGYNYAQDAQTGQCAIYLSRERLVRSTYREPWTGRVHEATPITSGSIARIPSDVCEWVHRKTSNAESSNDRNLRILEKWNEEEASVPRIVGYLGTENMVRGNIDIAIEYFTDYKGLPIAWPEEYAQVCRKLAQCYMITEQPELAIQSAHDGMDASPTWVDNYLTLSEGCFFKGEYQKGLEWAKLAQGFGVPDTMLIINPSDYTFLPSKLIALNLGGLGQLEEAVEVGIGALQMVPHDQFLGQQVAEWRSIQKREHTANTFAMCAEQLIAHDEQLKALTLLEDCVPVFATEHPRICSLRSMLRERLAWVEDSIDFAEHYESGGSKPEDFIADDTVTPLCEYLPRTQFLLAGLKEQIDATA